MPQCLGSFLRRARHIRYRFRSPIYPYIRRYFTNPPEKHIKIDDEERLQNDKFPIIPCYHHPTQILRMLLLLLLLLLLIIFLLAYIIYEPPIFIINLLQWKYPHVLFHLPLPSSQKIIALTLDDAPSSYTSEILDLLSAHNAKATFFIIGSQISSHPEITQRIHSEGHELGNHAWNDEPSLTLPPSKLDRQIMSIEKLLPPNPPLSLPSSSSSSSSSSNQEEETFNNPPKYFRPGSGFFNKKMVERVRSFGYRVALGSVYPHDPQIHSAWVNARHVLSMVRPGAVVIVHDRRGYSVEEVRLVLEGLKREGWRVVSLGGLIEADARVRVGLELEGEGEGKRR